MIKVLQVFKIMNQGGAETGVMQALRRLDRSKFEFTFLTLTNEKGYFDDEIYQLGGKIITWKKFKNPFLSPYYFIKLVKEHGPFDIIHTRLHHFSGYVLFLSNLAGIPIRITHSHSDIDIIKAKSTLLKKNYYSVMQRLIKKYATVGLAVSNSAAKSLYGEKWRNNPKFKVIYTGIDLEPYKINYSVTKKELLHVPEETFVIGHVGSFREPKNHIFMIKVLKELIKVDANVMIVFAGDGALRTTIEKKVNEYNLQRYAKFLGHFKEIPMLMKNIFDLFILPSINEGLPHVALEAQAAGIPSIFSENITREINILSDQNFFLPINKGVDVWVNKILEIKKKSNHKIKNAYQYIIGTSFDVEIGVKNLFKIYEDEYKKLNYKDVLRVKG